MNIKELQERYQSAKQALAMDKSEDNYRDIISMCYEILIHQRGFCQRDEFADALQLYEETVLSFWEQYRTAESLCQVVYFYGDWQILDYANPQLSDKYNPEKLTEKILEHFPIWKEDRCKEFMMYLCLRFLLLLQCMERIETVKSIIFSIFPPKERDRLEKFLEYKFHLDREEDM